MIGNPKFGRDIARLGDPMATDKGIYSGKVRCDRLQAGHGREIVGHVGLLLERLTLSTTLGGVYDNFRLHLNNRRSPPKMTARRACVTVHSEDK